MHLISFNFIIIKLLILIIKLQHLICRFVDQDTVGSYFMFVKQLQPSHKNPEKVYFELPSMCRQLEMVLSSDGDSVIEPFNIAHTAAVERLSDVSFVTKAFNPQVEERRKSRVGGRKSNELRQLQGASGTPGAPGV